MCIVIIYITNILQTYAVSIPLSQIPVGKVVSVNGLKFIKITDNQYLAVEPFGTMQGWNGCASLPNPACMAAGTCTTTTVKSQLFTQGPVLMDARDGKKYEIRKFPDGKCWMVDNLAYGGTTSASGSSDYCVSQDAVPTYGYGTGTANANWWVRVGASATYAEAATMAYGDCANPQLKNYGSGSPCYNSDRCGYYYNWQAAMQLPNCNYNNDACTYSTPTLTANFRQGICPIGWHLPSGGEDRSTSEFAVLDVAVGGEGGGGEKSGHAYTYFWRSSNASGVTVTDPWKNVYGGCTTCNESIGAQGAWGYWWSASTAAAGSAYTIYIRNIAMSFYNNGRYGGWSVRCVKN
jgi:uncharacterized protein (TIGR02145 family)